MIAKPLKAPPAARSRPHRRGEGAAAGDAGAAAGHAWPARAPTSGAWLCEIKLDGYRLMTRIEDGKVRADHARRPRLVGEDAGAGEGACRARLDSRPGSTARSSCWATNGTPDFNALQNAFDRSRTERIDYFLFDLPYFEGHDLRATPLVAAPAVAEAAARRTPARAPALQRRLRCRRRVDPRVGACAWGSKA